MNLCEKCYENPTPSSSCGHSYCLFCYISEYKIKIDTYIANESFQQFPQIDLSIKCLGCDTKHIIPGELILLELSNQGFFYDKEKFIILLDGIKLKIQNFQ